MPSPTLSSLSLSTYYFLLNSHSPLSSLIEKGYNPTDVEVRQVDLCQYLCLD